MYTTISFDRWSVLVMEKLLIKKGLFFGPFIVFRDEWIKTIVSKVRSVIPENEWGCPENEIDAVIKNKVYLILKKISENFLDSAFELAFLKNSVGVPTVGEYEILYFFISHLVKSGLFGTKTEALQFLLFEARCNYDEATHAKNVELLFLD